MIEAEGIRVEKEQVQQAEDLKYLIIGATKWKITQEMRQVFAHIKRKDIFTTQSLADFLPFPN